MTAGVDFQANGFLVLFVASARILGFATNFAAGGNRVIGSARGAEDAAVELTLTVRCDPGGTTLRVSSTFWRDHFCFSGGTGLQPTSKVALVSDSSDGGSTSGLLDRRVEPAHSVSEGVTGSSSSGTGVLTARDEAKLATGDCGTGLSAVRLRLRRLDLLGLPLPGFAYGGGP